MIDDTRTYVHDRCSPFGFAFLYGVGFGLGLLGLFWVWTAGDTDGNRQPFRSDHAAPK